MDDSAAATHRAFFIRVVVNGRSEIENPVARRLLADLCGGSSNIGTFGTLHLHSRTELNRKDLFLTLGCFLAQYGDPLASVECDGSMTHKEQHESGNLTQRTRF